MADTSPGYEANALLCRLVGFRLYSVQFVMDYVQLHFDGHTQDMPILDCDVMPAVTISGRTLTNGRAGYADALRSLISGTVARTEETTALVCGSNSTTAVSYSTRHSPNSQDPR